MGYIEEYKWTTDKTGKLQQGTVTHSFIIIPKCPYPLLGWNPLNKVQAKISFSGGTSRLSLGCPATD